MAGNEDLIMQYLMQQGGINQQQQGLAKKQAMLNQLRQGSAMPDMIQGGGARTIKAASPLSALADAGGKLIGAYKQKGLDTQADNLMGDSRSQLADMQWQAQQRQMEEDLRRKQAMGMQQPGAPMMGPDPGIDMTQGM